MGTQLAARPKTLPSADMTGTPLAAALLQTNFANYVKGQEHSDRMGILLGSSIFVVDGERWQWLRKTVVGMFSARRCAGDPGRITRVLMPTSRCLALLQSN